MLDRQACVQADLLVWEESPLTDIMNTREIHGVWISGNRIR